MEADRLTDRVLDMVNDALTRGLAVGEIVDCIDFTITLLPTPQGTQVVGLLFVAVKGPVLGTSLSNADMIPDLCLLASQKFIDDRVRVCLESIRASKASVLAGSNGHG